MKPCAFAVVFFSACTCNCQAAAVARRESVHFGPEDCVGLSRSSAGSCVITTDCQAKDVSNTEFAFNCIGEGGEGGIVRHSFGMGGFDAQEEFDTEVKCDRCDKPSILNLESKAQDSDPSEETSQPTVPPTPPKKHVPLAGNERKTNALKFVAQHREDSSSDAQHRMDAASDAVSYGPSSCVSTYKNMEGHCMIKTACQSIDTSAYTFGLVCVDKAGAPVRHLFGRDSFDPEETFDTQIPCDQCLGLEDVADSVTVSAEITNMTTELSKLRHMMQDLSMQVQRLNGKVFGSPESFAQTTAKTSLRKVRHSRHMVRRAPKHLVKRNLRHTLKRHHHARNYNENGFVQDRA
jgi:hypothetical protein